jgi:ubiquinol-cytochrome c reductase cytochrome c subunit
VLSVFAALTVGAAGAVAQTPAAPAQGASPGTVPAGNAENGKRAYMNYYCYACHGTVGQGGRDGARIAPSPPALATITRYVRKPSGQMPPYTSKVISDQELADIYAFLKTIPAPPPAKSIPLLNE